MGSWLQRLMLHGFPVPYPDELFWGLLGRYANRFRQQPQTALMEQAFGSTTVTPTVDFPSRLRFFAAQLLPGHPCTAEVLLREHTCFPWYEPFLPEFRAKSLRESILGDGTSSTWTVAGVVSGRVQFSAFLRFCPKCLAEDLAEYREPHWRRLHQLPGVEACPRHETLLEDSAIPRLRKLKRLKLETPPESLAATRTRSVCDESLLRIARLGDQLLQARWPALGLDGLRSRYLARLLKNKYAKRRLGVRVDVRRLATEIQQEFPAGFLLRLGCQGTRWIEEMVRSNDSAQPPTSHMLLLAFLGIGLDEFFDCEPEPEFPPKERPGNLVCRNPVCPARNSQVSEYLREIYSNPLKGTVEFYRCPVCCQVQQRCTAGRERIWVRDYGRMWREKLTSLWHDPNQGYREMAEILGRSADTIKSQAIKAGLPLPRPGQEKTSIQRFRHLLKSKSEVRQAKINEMRARWLDVRAKFPDRNVRALRAAFPAVYATLYRYDRQWLLANQPKLRRWWPKGVPRSDWQSRDEVLSNRISLVASRLRHGLRPGQRLTPSALAKAVGLRDWLIHRLAKLPKCRSVLLRDSDATIDFALRVLSLGPEVEGIWFVSEERKGRSLVKHCDLPLIQAKWSGFQLDRWAADDFTGCLINN